jgi:hypothetical protein
MAVLNDITWVFRTVQITRVCVLLGVYYIVIIEVFFIYDG